MTAIAKNTNNTGKADQFFTQRLKATSSISGAFLGIALALAPIEAAALPTNPDIVQGNISINSTVNTTTVNQTSNKGIINWDTFDIGVGETTHFNQPGANSVTLNRVTGSQNPSQILGTLSANGRIVLVNPNGMYFGRNSRVDVNGLIASTADISNEDFLADRLRFNKAGNADAKIVNYGVMSAKERGLISLVAPGVENHGIIRATKGTVAIGTGETATLDFYGDELINFAVDGETVKGITNTGTVSAQGGSIYMTAAAATQVVDNVINTSGIVEASSAHVEGGVIVLGGGNGGVKVSGKVESTGTKGGNIRINGDRVELSNATIDASGQHGGGDIVIGGDKRSGETDIARITLIDRRSMLAADATESGEGGSIVIWSEDATRFEGSLSAKGFTRGGFAEVSSSDLLGFDGIVDLSAVSGENGLLLLDPDKVTIGTNTSDDGEVADGVVNSGDGSGTFKISSTAIETALNLASVIIEAITSITVSADIDGSAAPAGNGLTLDAATVNVNKNITLNDADLNLFAGTINVKGDLNVGTGNVNVNGVGGTGGATKFTQNGSSTITAASFFGTDGIDTTTLSGTQILSGGLDVVVGTKFSHNGTMTASGAFVTDGGQVTLKDITAERIGVTNSTKITSKGALHATGAKGSGDIELRSSGAIAMNGTLKTDDDKIIVKTSNGKVEAKDTITASGAITLDGDTVIANKIENTKKAKLNLNGDTITLKDDVTLVGNSDITLKNKNGKKDATKFTQNAGSTITARKITATKGVATFIMNGLANLKEGLNAKVTTAATFKDTLTLGGQLKLTGGGKVTLDDVSAKKIDIVDAASITANGELRTTGKKDKGKLSLTADGNITLKDNLVAEKDFINVVSANGTINADAGITAAEHVYLSAGKSASVDGATSGSDVEIIAQNGNIEMGAVTSTEENIDLDATKLVTVNGVITADENLDIRGTTVTLHEGANAASGEIEIVATHLKLGDDLTFLTEEIATPKVTIMDNDASIQQGLDLVDVDGVVALEAGTFTQGDLQVKNGVDLVGDGIDQTFIDATGFNNAVVFGDSADNSKLTDMDITGSTWAAIRIDADHGTIDKLTFEDLNVHGAGLAGIVLRDETTVNNWIISNSSFSDNGSHGVRVREESVVGKLTVKNTSFDNNAGDGFMSEEGATINNATFDKNKNGNTSFDGNDGHGLNINATTKLTLDEVSMSGNGSYGFFVDSGTTDTAAQITVRESTIENNASGGVSINTGSGNSINWVRFIDNTFGDNQPVQIDFNGDIGVKLAKGNKVKDLDDQTGRNEAIDDILTNNTFETVVYITDELAGDWTGPTTLWGNIQPAIKASSVDDWINIGEGIYDETLVISHNLNLFGVTTDKSKVQIVPTENPIGSFLEYGSSRTILPIVMVDHADITMQNITIDGTNVQTGYTPTDRLVGIGLNHGGGTIQDVHVTNIYDDGSGFGTGIYAQSMSKGVRGSTANVVFQNVGAVQSNTVKRGYGPEENELLISNTLIDNVQKSAVHLNGNNLTGVILENEFTGAGEGSTEVQDMISLTGGVAGGVYGNIISNIYADGSNGIYVGGVRADNGFDEPTYFIEENLILGVGNKSTTGIYIEKDALVFDPDILFPGDIVQGIDKLVAVSALDCTCSLYGDIALLDNDIGNVEVGIENNLDFVDIHGGRIDARDFGINDSGFATIIHEVTIDGADTGLKVTGLADLSDAKFTNNKTGILVRNGGDLYINDTTVTGGKDGLVVNGGASTVVFDDYDGSSFSGQSRHAIRLVNGALDDETLDIDTVYLNGELASTIIASVGESLVYDENDNGSVGDIEFVTDTTGGGGDTGGGGGDTGSGGGDTGGGGGDTGSGGGDTGSGGGDTGSGGGDTGSGGGDTGSGGGDTGSGGGDTGSGGGDTGSGGGDTGSGGGDTGSGGGDTGSGGGDTGSGGGDTGSGGGDTGSGGGDTGSGGGDTTSGGDDTAPGGGSDVTDFDDSLTGAEEDDLIRSLIEEKRYTPEEQLFSLFGETLGSGFSFQGALADLSLLAGSGGYSGLNAAELGSLAPAAGGEEDGEKDEGKSCVDNYLAAGFMRGYSLRQCQ